MAVTPVLFSLGSRPIYAYTVVLGSALLAGLAWIVWRERRMRDGLLDVVLVALVAGLIGARLVHVLANGAYYAERPADALLSLDGGMSFHGGLFAGLAVVTIAALRRPSAPPRSFGRLLVVIGALVVPLSLGVFGGWLACLLRGCAYGQAIPPPQHFYTVDWPDIFGVYAFRLPSQALGMAFALVLLATAGFWTRRPGLFFVVLGLSDFAIAATRGDLAVTWGPLWAIQWADLALVVFGVLLETAARPRGRRVV